MDVDTALIDVISALLGANLLGIYAYGPSAPSAEPTTRALLVVTARDLLRDTRYALTQTFLRHSREAEPLEVLVVRQADLVAQPSVLVQFHYTEAEREQLAAQVGSIAWLSWTDGSTGSVDRAELIGHLQQTGRTITGQ
ncbi:MAG TPA: hypothetical protein VIO16_00040, partial [Dehalococcoidia bacterium]